MNERIQELALQAGLSHMPSNYPDMADLYKGADFELAKFAELIVRECIDTVLDSSVEYATRPQIANEIKEHFGVDGMSTEDKKTLIKELLGVNK